MGRPGVAKIRQKLKGSRIRDVAATLRGELVSSGFRIKKGSNLAIAVGSRGIANLPAIVREVASFVTEKGGNPFIIPAMGSHGGATAQGQRDVLESLGVSEAALGIRVLSSMDVVELPSGSLPFGLFMDRFAFESDGVILINRIKPHTDFHGPYESGPVKMSVVGLGKHRQALEIHGFGIKGLRDFIPMAARLVFRSGKIVMGLAIVENACDETAVIRALKPSEIFEEEPKLLKKAYENMPHFPVDKIDVLVVDRMGKDISGTGLDSNIIGRLRIRGEKEPELPDIKNIVVCDLTEASHGNAVGVGFADVITKKLFDRINFEAMYENVITSTFLDRARVPVVAENPGAAFDIALRACSPIEKGKERIVRVLDTLHMEDLRVSEAILEEISDSVSTSVEFLEMFDTDGELVAF